MIFNFTVEDKYEKSANLLKVLYIFIMKSFKEKADRLKVAERIMILVHYKTI